MPLIKFCRHLPSCIGCPARLSLLPSETVCPCYVPRTDFITCPTFPISLFASLTATALLTCFLFSVLFLPFIWAYRFTISDSTVNSIVGSDASTVRQYAIGWVVIDKAASFSIQPTISISYWWRHRWSGVHTTLSKVFTPHRVVCMLGCGNTPSVLNTHFRV